MYTISGTECGKWWAVVKLVGHFPEGEKAHQSQETDRDMKVTHLFTRIDYIIPSSKFLQPAIKKKTAK